MKELGWGYKHPLANAWFRLMCYLERVVISFLLLFLPFLLLLLFLLLFLFLPVSIFFFGLFYGVFYFCNNNEVKHIQRLFKGEGRNVILRIWLFEIIMILLLGNCVTSGQLFNIYNLQGLRIPSSSYERFKCFVSKSLDVTIAIGMWILH